MNSGDKTRITKPTSLENDNKDKNPFPSFPSLTNDIPTAIHEKTPDITLDESNVKKFHQTMPEMGATPNISMENNLQNKTSNASEDANISTSGKTGLERCKTVPNANDDIDVSLQRTCNIERTTEMEDIPMQIVLENNQPKKKTDVEKNVDKSEASHSWPLESNEKKDIDIFPELQRESSCESTSLSRITRAVSASRAAQKLKQQRTMSKDRSEDSKH